VGTEDGNWADRFTRNPGNNRALDPGVFECTNGRIGIEVDAGNLHPKWSVKSDVSEWTYIANSLENPRAGTCAC